MKNIEKIKLFFEDVYEASCFWDNDEKKKVLTIFIDDIREFDHIALIKESLMRPLRTVKEEEKYCIPGDFGPIVLSEDAITGNLVIHRRNDAGFIPYDFEPYLVYFLNEDISSYPNGKNIKNIMDNYFATRNII